MYKYLLDKIIPANKKYRVESDKVLVIQKVGCDNLETGTLRVAGSPVLNLRWDLAPLTGSGSNTYDLLDLKDNFIVIPPNKEFVYEAEPGRNFRMRGYILELLPGETIPTNLLARFTEQSRKYMTFLRSVYYTPNGISISTGQEFTILDFTAPTGEIWTFNSRLASHVGSTKGTAYYGNWNVRFYLNDKPLDIFDINTAPLGISQYSIPSPPNTMTSMYAYDLSEFPITVEPGRNFKVKAVWNGPNVTLQSDESVEIAFTILAERRLI